MNGCKRELGTLGRSYKRIARLEHEQARLRSHSQTVDQLTAVSVPDS